MPELRAAGQPLGALMDDRILGPLGMTETRLGEGPFAQFMFEGRMAFLGDPETKQDDRTKWGQFKSEKQTEGELSGISHFPFMLAADRDSYERPPAATQ